MQRPQRKGTRAIRVLGLASAFATSVYLRVLVGQSQFDVIIRHGTVIDEKRPPILSLADI